MGTRFCPARDRRSSPRLDYVAALAPWDARGAWPKASGEAEAHGAAAPGRRALRRALRAGGLRALLRRRAPRAEAARRPARRRRDLAASGRGRKAVLAAAEVVPDRAGRANGDRQAERSTRAFVGGPTGSTLIVAPAAGSSMATALVERLHGRRRGRARRRSRSSRCTRCRQGDAAGNVSFLVVMALIIGGYLASTIGMAFGGPPTRRRRRLASLAMRVGRRGAAHRRDRRARARRASQLEVPRALGHLRARDDGRLVRHGRPAGRCSVRPERWSWSCSS